jgi:hypothetical protein
MTFSLSPKQDAEGHRRPQVDGLQGEAQDGPREPAQVVHATLQGGLGEDAGGFLEAGGGDEAFGGERGLGDARSRMRRATVDHRSTT